MQNQAALLLAHLKAGNNNLFIPKAGGE